MTAAGAHATLEDDEWTLPQQEATMRTDGVTVHCTTRPGAASTATTAPVGRLRT